MGHLLSVHGSCLHDAVGGRSGLAMPNAVHVPHGLVHADVWVLQPSCAVDALCSVHQEEGIAVACANSCVCMPEPLGHMDDDRWMRCQFYKERGHRGHVVLENAVRMLFLCLAGTKAAGGAVVEDHWEHCLCAALPTWIFLAVQLYDYLLLVGLCDEGP